MHLKHYVAKHSKLEKKSKHTKQTNKLNSRKYFAILQTNASKGNVEQRFPPLFKKPESLTTGRKLTDGKQKLMPFCMPFSSLKFLWSHKIVNIPMMNVAIFYCAHINSNEQFKYTRKVPHGSDCSVTA